MNRLTAAIALAFCAVAPLAASAQGINLIFDTPSTLTIPDPTLTTTVTDPNYGVLPGGTVDIGGYIQNTNSYAEILDGTGIGGPWDTVMRDDTSVASVTDLINGGPITVPANTTVHVEFAEVSMTSVPLGTSVVTNYLIYSNETGDQAVGEYTATAAVPEFSTVAMLLMGGAGVSGQFLRRRR